MSAKKYLNPGTTGLLIYEKYLKITKSDAKWSPSSFVEKSCEQTFDLKLRKNYEDFFRYHDFY